MKVLWQDVLRDYRVSTCSYHLVGSEYMTSVAPMGHPSPHAIVMEFPWPTMEEAEAGHKDVVEKIRSGKHLQ